MGRRRVFNLLFDLAVDCFLYGLSSWNLLPLLCYSPSTKSWEPCRGYEDEFIDGFILSFCLIDGVSAELKRFYRKVQPWIT